MVLLKAQLSVVSLLIFCILGLALNTGGEASVFGGEAPDLGGGAPTGFADLGNGAPKVMIPRG